MHIRRALVLFAFALLVVPLHSAFASCSGNNPQICKTAKSNQGGITIFNFPVQPGSGITADISGFWSSSSDPDFKVIWADIQANFNAKIEAALPSESGALGTSPAWGFFDSPGGDADSFVSSGTATMNQVCQDIDSDLGPGSSSALATQQNYRNFSSSGNNAIFLYSGSKSLWAGESTNDSSNNAAHVSALTCTSYALPYNSIDTDATTANNNYTIMSGDTATIKLEDDSASVPYGSTKITTYDGTNKNTTAGNYTAYSYAGIQRDSIWELAWSDYPYVPDGLSDGNYYDPSGPEETCTASASPSDSSFNPSAANFTSDYTCPNSDWTGPDKNGYYTCTNPNPYSPSKPDIYPQNVKVSPTRPTTYTYTCTNPNGTTAASVTVNVVKQPTANLTASPTSIDLGNTTTLTYNCSANSTKGVITGSDGYSSGSLNSDNLDGSNHSITVTPSPNTPSNLSNGASVSYTLTCTGPSGTTPATNGASVQVDAPDLNPGSVNPSPNSPAVNQDTSFVVATVANNGGVSTGGTFKDLLEVYKGSGTVGQSSTEPGSSFKFNSLNPNYLQYFPTNSSLGAGKSTSDTITGYDFPSGGTWWVRDCANTGSNGDTPVDSYAGNQEWSYSNNCTGWVEVDVNAQPTANLKPATATTLEATSSPAAVPVTLSYTCSANSTAGTIMGTDGYSYAISGSNLDGSAHNKSVTPSWSAAAPTTTYTLTCTGPSGTTPATDTSKVTVTPMPDFTATTISPTTVTADVSLSFSANVENTGDGASGGAFPVLYQEATSAGGANATNIGTDASAPALAANGSENSTMDGTFSPPSSNFWVRACANTLNNTTFALPETNIGNNCGGWIPITVQPGAVPTVSCGVTPSNGTTATTFVWAASASGGSGSGYTYAWSGTSLSSQTGAQVSATYPSAGAYGGTVTATDGTGASSAPTTCAGGGSLGAATATVNQAPAITSFAPNASTIPCNGSTKLTWGSTNATSCTGTGFSTGGAANNSSGVTVSPTSNPSNYQLACQDAAGDKVYANTSVAIASPQTSINISPASIPEGGTGTVTWSASQVSSCTVTANGTTIGSGNADGNGNFSTGSPYTTPPLTGAVTYVITCQLTADQQACANSSTVTATAITNVVTSFGNF